MASIASRIRIPSYIPRHNCCSRMTSLQVIRNIHSRLVLPPTAIHLYQPHHPRPPHLFTDRRYINTNPNNHTNTNPNPSTQTDTNTNTQTPSNTSTPNNNDNEENDYDDYNEDPQ